MYYRITSDEDENFYVPSVSVISKYDNNGELVDTYTINHSAGGFTNLIYSNKHIYLVTKRYPFYFTDIDTESGEVVQTKILDKNLRREDAPSSSNQLVTDLTLSLNGNYIYFAINIPNKIFRYDIKNKNLEQNYINITGKVVHNGLHYDKPVNLTENKIAFVTEKGFVEVIDHQNFYNFVYEKFPTTAITNPTGSLSLKYYNLVKDKEHQYYFKREFICKLRISDGSVSLCKDVFGLDKSGQPFPYTHSLQIYYDNSQGFLFGVLPYSDGNGNTIKGIFKINTSDFSNLKFYPLPSDNTFDHVGIYVDSLGVLSAPYSKGIWLFDLDEKEKIIPFNDFPDGYKLKAISSVSPTSKGNFYVLTLAKKFGSLSYKTTVYKIKGSLQKEDDCPLGFYCNSVPKYHPVILVHGLAGSYTDWIDGNRKVIRQMILNKYREDDKEFPDSWVSAYSYGYDFAQNYDYQGKVEDISDNMHFLVEKLSKEHKQAGGDGKVDIVAYSLGGLLSRHYILEKIGYPNLDKVDLTKDTSVRKLILIASPVAGDSVLQKVDDAADFTGSLIEPGKDYYRKKFRAKVSEYMTKALNVDVNLNDHVGTQLASESSYIKTALKFPLPKEPEYYRIYANIRLSVRHTLFGKNVTKNLNLGDGIVLPEDTDIVNGSFKDERLLEIESSSTISFNKERKSFTINYDVLNPFKIVYYIHIGFLYNKDVKSTLLNFLLDK